jgi:hypothetical protein
MATTRRTSWPSTPRSSVWAARTSTRSITSDGTAADLAPGTTQSYLAQAQSFGTDALDPGTYEVVAWYQSKQSEWFPVPSGDAGTSTTTTVDAS